MIHSNQIRLALPTHLEIFYLSRPMYNASYFSLSHQLKLASALRRDSTFKPPPKEVESLF